MKKVLMFLALMATLSAYNTEVSDFQYLYSVIYGSEVDPAAITVKEKEVLVLDQLFPAIELRVKGKNPLRQTIIDLQDTNLDFHQLAELKIQEALKFPNHLILKDSFKKHVRIHNGFQTESLAIDNQRLYWIVFEPLM